MRFRIWTIFWVFALLASAMATFGTVGILAAALVVGFWFYLETRPGVASFVELLVICVILGVVIALLLPAVQSAREASCRSSCMNNMKQIALALHGYADDHGSLPPAYIADENGKPMHSWRVLILPYLEHEKLYGLYDFDEPWDGPNNRELWKHMPEIYRCPSCTRAEEYELLKCPPHTTNYFAVVGPKTVWPDSTTKKLSDISDGASQTVLFMESSEPICWMEPKDISFEDAVEQLTEGSNNGHLTVSNGFFALRAYCLGRNVAFADGYVRFIDNHLSSDAAELLLTANGGNEIDWDESLSVERHSRVYHVATIVKWRRVYSFSVFVCLSLLPLLKYFRRDKVK